MLQKSSDTGNIHLKLCKLFVVMLLKVFVVMLLQTISRILDFCFHFPFGNTNFSFTIFEIAPLSKKMTWDFTYFGQFIKTKDPAYVRIDICTCSFHDQSLIVLS